jgi:poly-gamma-glutamate synthesis protein (capsule biosynthesis protein)
MIGVALEDLGRDPMSSGATLTLFLCGDVMTGRGIDQILAHPSDPEIHESYLRRATDYVELAETVNGPILREVGDKYIWGDALEELDRVRPDARIINLETAITTSNDWCDKGINYRMHPANIGCLKAAQVDVCSLANNHILDWGEQGLIETCESLKKAGIQTAGAGGSWAEAWRPASVTHSQGGRVLVWSFASETSGVPDDWAAKDNRPGVNLLRDLSVQTLTEIENQIAAVKRPGDTAVFSVHWGDNWGYGISESRRKFSHALIDQAHVDVVHGHSSHHAIGIEVYRGKLILYGCGDFITDYEGIAGYEEYRGDISLMYLPSISPFTGELQSCRIVPFTLKRFQLKRSDRESLDWIQKTLNREGRRFNTSVDEDARALWVAWG